jgi:hypothetical protein
VTVVPNNFALVEFPASATLNTIFPSVTWEQHMAVPTILVAELVVYADAWDGIVARWSAGG